MSVTIYWASEWLRGKPQLQGVFFGMVPPVIIVGKGSQYPGHFPAYCLCGQCACFLWKGTILERSVNICMWYGHLVSWGTPLRRVKMFVIGCSVLEGGHDSLHPLVGVGSNKDDKCWNLTTTKLLFIQTRLFIQNKLQMLSHPTGSRRHRQHPRTPWTKGYFFFKYTVILIRLQFNERGEDVA